MSAIHNFSIIPSSPFQCLIAASDWAVLAFLFSTSEWKSFPFLCGVREQQMIGLQVLNRLVSTSSVNPSQFGASKRACCDTLLFPAMLQCSAHHQLTDNPGIDNILLSIHDSIGIRDFAGQQVIGAQQCRTPYSESFFCVFCFPMVILPLLRSVSRSSGILFFYEVEWIWHDLESIVDFFDLVWQRHETHTTCAENCSFLLNISGTLCTELLWKFHPSSYISIFPSSLIVRLEASLNTWDVPFFSLCASRMTSLLLFTLSNCQAGVVSSFFRSWSIAAFASEIFIACGIGIILWTKLKWVIELNPPSAMWSSCFLGRAGSKRFLVDSRAFTIHGYSVIPWILWSLEQQFPAASSSAFLSPSYKAWLNSSEHPISSLRFLMVSLYSPSSGSMK